MGLGCSINRSTGVIGKIKPETQASRVLLKEGMRIQKINGIPFEFKNLINFMKEKQQFTMQIDYSQVRFEFLTRLSQMLFQISPETNILNSFFFVCQTNIEKIQLKYSIPLHTKLV